MARNFFVNRTNNVVVRVAKVDANFAIIETLTGNPGKHMMAVAEYDTKFVETFRPATEADLAPIEGEGFRLPANAPDSWR